MLFPRFDFRTKMSKTLFWLDKHSLSLIQTLVFEPWGPVWLTSRTST